MSPDLVPWLVGAMTSWAPPTPANAELYDPIARDILTVAFDASEAPLYEDEDGRARTALLLASFAEAESGGFRVSVDSGKKRGDGNAVCIMQVRASGPFSKEMGWSSKDLLADRTKCVRVALHEMRASMVKCKKFKDADKLGAFTHGRCVENNSPARWRWGRAATWMKGHAPLPEWRS